jgi:branched-chain amino acid transport system permease protein
MSHLLTRGSLMAIGGLAVAVAAPFVFGDPYRLHVLILIVLSVALASSLNLTFGIAGQISFATAAFYGIGAYTAGILSTRYDTPFLVNLVAAIVVTSLFGLLVGVPSLRLTGHYLAIATIGFQAMTLNALLNWSSLTRGPAGIYGIPKASIFGFRFDTVRENYFLILTITVIIVAVIARLAHTGIGLELRAVREDELPARAVGVNTTKVKLLAFVAGAAMAGTAGVFYAHYIGSIDPYPFDLLLSATILVMVLLGGAGSIPGAIVGAVLLTLLPELTRGLDVTRMVVYGVVLILIVFFLPDGLAGIANRVLPTRLRGQPQQIGLEAMDVEVTPTGSRAEERS